MKQSCCKFTQPLVNETPRYASPEWRKKAKAGRPAKGAPKQHWLKK